MKTAPAKFHIRKATSEDITAIENLLAPFIEEDTLLPRSRAEIHRELPWTWVAQSTGSEELLGVMNFSFFPPEFAEIRGLAVKKEAHGQGIGRVLVETALSELSQKNPPVANVVFALTYVPQFFLSLGFEVVPKEQFPAKIYEVCQYCNKQENCQEIAVRKKLPV